MISKKAILPYAVNLNNYHTLEVAGRSSETQPQVGDNYILCIYLQHLKSLKLILLLTIMEVFLTAWDAE